MDVNKRDIEKFSEKIEKDIWDQSISENNYKTNVVRIVNKIILMNKSFLKKSIKDNNL